MINSSSRSPPLGAKATAKDISMGVIVVEAGGVVLIAATKLAGTKTEAGGVDTDFVAGSSTGAVTSDVDDVLGVDPAGHH